MLGKLSSVRKHIISSTFMISTLYLSNSLFYPFLTPYLLSHGFDKQQISFISALAPLTLILFPPIFGKLSDIIGRRKVISITIAIFVVSLLFYLGVGHSYLFLVVATVLSYIGFDNASAVIFSKNEDSLKKHRSLYTGVFESLKNVGGLIGAGVGTYIVATSKTDNTIKLSILILVLLFIYNTFRKRHERIPLNLHGLNPLTSIREFWAIRDLRGMGILGIAMHFANAASIIFIPVLLIQGLHADIRYIGYFAAAGSLAHLTQFGFGYACELYGQGRTILWSTFIYGLLITLLFFANSPWVVVAFGLLGGLALSAWNTSAVCYMSVIGERLREEGLVMGSYTAVASIGSFAGFIVSGILVSLVATNYLFPIYGAVIFVGVALSYPYFRRSRHY